MSNFTEQKSLDAVVVDTTGDAVNIEGKRGLGVQLQCANHSQGNGVFTFEGTIDGKNWVALNVMIDNLTNTNAQGYTRVATKTLSSDTTILLWLDDAIALKAFRVVVDVTTDGTYTANVIARE